MALVKKKEKVVIYLCCVCGFEGKVTVIRTTHPSGGPTFAWVCPSCGTGHATTRALDTMRKRCDAGNR
jgi:hypothetical protein